MRILDILFAGWLFCISLYLTNPLFKAWVDALI